MGPEDDLDIDKMVVPVSEPVFTTQAPEASIGLYQIEQMRGIEVHSSLPPLSSSSSSSSFPYLSLPKYPPDS